MKIGIVTFFKANNYGAVLQCYSLQEYLKSLGNEVAIIQVPSEKKATNIRQRFREFFVSQPFNTFREKYLTKVEELGDCDVYFFGSDQIWNTTITKDHASFYFGKEIPDGVLKVAYAASFGVSKWEGTQSITDEVRPLIKSFHALGVRENSGVEICKDMFGLDVQQVLDPTFLINDFSNLFSKFITTNVMTCYLFNKEKNNINILRSIARKKELKVTILNDVRIRQSIKSIPYPRIQTWLSYIYTSNLVVTDSFHGMVFAIKAKRNFFAVPALKARASRMTSLLESLGLSHRYFESLEEILSSDELNKDIDFKIVEEKLQPLQEASKQFIKNCLEPESTCQL